jgi:hypothetical protein
MRKSLEAVLSATIGSANKVKKLSAVALMPERMRSSPEE